MQMTVMQNGISLGSHHQVGICLSLRALFVTAAAPLLAYTLILYFQPCTVNAVRPPAAPLLPC
jgi:hypothetical protein